MTETIVLLIGVGLFLSAFFSGSETGFYRVTRLRLLLDGLGGDRISRSLLRLTNNPALFVATTLVGNNLANYLLSFGIVLAVEQIFHQAHLAELVAPLVLSPVVFIYCELLPKQLFYYAPNRLLRGTGPLLLLFAVLLAPVAAVLWLLGRCLELVVGQTPLRVQLTLARQELQQALIEGHAVGILHPTQRDLATRLFATGSRNIRQFSAPLGRVNSIPLGAAYDEAIKVAKQKRSPLVLVRRPETEELIGYVRVIDLKVMRPKRVEKIRTMTRIADTDSHIQALVHMRREKTDLAIVEDDHGNPLGLVDVASLVEPLFQET
jgi:putative hemolysin